LNQYSQKILLTGTYVEIYLLRKLVNRSGSNMGRTYLSFSATVILQAVANGYVYGFDIMDMTGLPGGTVYPALRRLEEMGYVLSKWEKQVIAQKEARPPRKYYQLTGDGEEALTEAVKRYRVLDQPRSRPNPTRPSRERA
jgi:DNA-binding PadR family transcriptional regulator